MATLSRLSSLLLLTLTVSAVCRVSSAGAPNPSFRPWAELRRTIGNRNSEISTPAYDGIALEGLPLRRQRNLRQRIAQHRNDAIDRLLCSSEGVGGDREHGRRGPSPFGVAAGVPPSMSAANLALSSAVKPLVLTLAGATALKSISSLVWSNQPFRRAFYFWRKIGPIVVHYKFTKFWLDHVTHAPKEKRDQVYERLHDRYSEPSLEVILHLKGLYVKMGQVLSARPDFCPRQYLDLFSTVQDSLPQQSLEEVREMIDEALTNVHGLSFDEVFESMDPIALGAASIGQCHRAVLKSSRAEGAGIKAVAVKVMHPEAESRFRYDFQVFRWLCRLAMPGWTPILDELERRLMSEFDYRNEAENLAEVRRNMAKSKFSNLVQVPIAIPSLTCKNVLVMELLEGIKLSDYLEDRIGKAVGLGKEEAKAFIRQRRDALLTGEQQQASDEDSEKSALDQLRSFKGEGSKSSWLDDISLLSKFYLLRRYVKNTVQTLCDVHGHQIFVDGCFNGDPHPGNVLALENGKLGLIDYGQTKRLTEKERHSLAKVIVGLGRKDGPPDIDEVANAMREFGFRTKFNKSDVLAKHAALFFDSDEEGKRLGCSTPQMYVQLLNKMDPLQAAPDAAVFVARTSWMFRGMGSIIQSQVHTAKEWRDVAESVLLKDDEAESRTNNRSKTTDDSGPKKLKATKHQTVHSN